MNVRKVVGWNLRKFRLERQLTIEDLAGICDVDSSFLARMERGTVNSSIDLLSGVAEVLKIRMFELFVEPLPGAVLPKALPKGPKPARRRARRTG